MSSNVHHRPTAFDVAYQELTDRRADVGELKVDRAKVKGAETLPHHVDGFGGAPRETNECEQHGLKPMSVAHSAHEAEMLALVNATLRIQAGDPRDVFGKGGGGGS